MCVIKLFLAKPAMFLLGVFANPITVMRTAHCSVPRLYFTEGNSIADLSFSSLVEADVKESGIPYYKNVVKEARRLLRAYEKSLKDYEAKLKVHQPKSKRRASHD
jgi:hypothetical protein